MTLEEWYIRIEKTERKTSLFLSMNKKDKYFFRFLTEKQRRKVRQDVEKEIGILIPAHNEEEGALPGLVRELKKKFPLGGRSRRRFRGQDRRGGTGKRRCGSWRTRRAGGRERLSARDLSISLNADAGQY